MKAERLRQDRASRGAGNLALAYWIDGLIRSGAVPDLETVARMCGVSRARVSKVAGLLGMAGGGAGEDAPSSRNRDPASIPGRRQH